LKDEIVSESVAIATQRLIERLGADAIELREIGIEHYLFTANEEY
jgi:hypothetical protein